MLIKQISKEYSRMCWGPLLSKGKHLEFLPWVTYCHRYTPIAIPSIANNKLLQLLWSIIIIIDWLLHFDIWHFRAMFTFFTSQLMRVQYAAHNYSKQTCGWNFKLYFVPNNNDSMGNAMLTWLTMISWPFPKEYTEFRVLEQKEQLINPQNHTENK